MSLQGNGDYDDEEIGWLRGWLRDFSVATRAVVKATQHASGERRTPDTEAALESKRSKFVSSLKTLLTLGLSFDADGIIQAAKCFLKTYVDPAPRGTPNTDLDVEEFRSRADRRIREITKGEVGEQETSISTLKGVHLFDVRATPPVAAEVQTLMWTLVELAAREETRHDKERRALTKQPNDSQEEADHDAYQGPDTLDTDDGADHRTAGASSAGASAAVVPGVGVPAVSYSPSSSAPSTGSAAGNNQPERHFVTLQHEAPRRVPPKKRRHASGPNVGNIPALGGGGTVVGGGSVSSNAAGGGAAGVQGGRFEAAQLSQALRGGQRASESGAHDAGGALTDATAAAEDVVADETAAAAASSATAASSITTATAGDTDVAPVASVSLKGPQGCNVVIGIGDNVEHRWGSQGRWYRCSLSLVQGQGASTEVELEFLPRTQKTTKAGKSFSEILLLDQLVSDGDLAPPGTHLDWE